MPIAKRQTGTRCWISETKREDRGEFLFPSRALRRSWEQWHRCGGRSRWVGRCSVCCAQWRLQAQMRGDLVSRLLVQDANAAVARFEGRAGIFRYETVELIRFSDQGVTFEHLRGPFRSCIERFEFVPLADGAHALEHRGTFVMRGGLLGWLFGVLVIRGAFDRLVASHMQHSSGVADP
jgi:hypothetical protein